MPSRRRTDATGVGRAAMKAAHQASGCRLDPAFREITFEGGCRFGATGLCKCHIRIRPDKIERVTSKACRHIVLSPCENMEWQLMTAAPGGDLASCRTIDMDLPPHACERREIVRAFRRDPGQAIAALDAARSAPAQRSSSVVQHGLRH